MFCAEYYDRIRQVALLCSVAIIAAIFLLLFLNVPLQESNEFTTWRSVLYYTIMVYVSLLGGMMIMVVFLLYSIVTALISAVDPHVDASMILESAQAGDDGRDEQLSAPAKASAPFER